MDLVNVEPACIIFEEEKVAKHSDKAQDCRSGLNISRDVYHSVPFIWIFCMEKYPKQCWDNATLTLKQINRAAESSTDFGWELFTDDHSA